MTMSEELKHTCPACRGRIAYEVSFSGKTIQCPHCGEAITLGEPLPAANETATPAIAPLTVAAVSATRTPRGYSRTIAVLALLLLLALGVGIGLRTASKTKRETQLWEAEELVRSKAEAAKAKAEAEKTKVNAEEEERSKAAVVAAAEAEAVATAKRVAIVEEIARREAEQKAQAEEKRRARAQQNPVARALWKEEDHATIQITATRESDATIKYLGTNSIVKYVDMPEWLTSMAQTKYKDDGEARGQIREVDGKVYDLRTGPTGWRTLPTAEVIQVLEDGYLMMDEASLNDRFALKKVFRLRHNGLTRILSPGDRIQVVAMSIGTYTYETKESETKVVPFYDPGTPVGPLREKVIAMNGRPMSEKPSPAAKRVKLPSDGPVASGSGFFISDDGLFITNAHVVEDSTKIEVRTAAGKKSANVLRVDKDKDLALLRVAVVKGTVGVLTISTNKVSLGKQVFTIGYPMIEVQGSRPKYTDGKISSLAGIRDDPERMQISVPVQPGNSGGPLADANGEIVGIIVSRLNFKSAQNVNYAVKGAILIEFLRENTALVPGLKWGGDATKRSQDEAIQAVEKASGLVLIY